MFTLEELKLALPPHLKASASQDLVDKVNGLTTDPEYAQAIKENVVSYTGILKEGRFKIEDYLHAVAYVSYKLMGYNNQESYKRVFPGKYASLVANGADDKTISAYVAAFNKGKMVNLILEQTLVPTWVLNQDVYQKAINTQAELMMYAKSEKVRSDAANSILTHLKRPEKTQVELNIGLKETSGMTELKDMLTVLAHRQQSLIEQGVNTREIAHQKLVPGAIEGVAKDITPV
jgi:hypothetical protein